MLVAIAALAFAFVTLTVWWIFQPKENVVSQRIRGASQRPMTRERRLQGSLRQRALAPAAAAAGRLLARLLPQNVVRGIDHMLIVAGEPMSLPAYLTLWVAAVVLALVVVYLTFSAHGIPSALRFVISIYVLLFLVMAPYLMMRRLARNRQKSITRALPDALDLLVTCIEAGLGVDAAFAKVTEKTSGPISETFALYLKQVGWGRSRRQALADIAERTGVPDLIQLAASVAQAEEMGIQSVTCSGYKRMICGSCENSGRKRLPSAPVMMTIPLVLCFLPAILAVVVVPSILSLMRYIGAGGSLGVR